ncbi:GNAT family N-acetyltransferase [Cohnella sp. REN36]|uniref:GNAT family N-acetyltransferase n=1 Tax=Cohnella sp. REN36 TaxID=2887347 RepID=UPI001D1469A3|nr:GNAT family N-acetyltransferase [Cohnella sp. REN36]MCC3374028.1 GNAT family N-acetyltransferase [Cohnella sp. REN36]
MKLHYRKAGADDVPALAEMNLELIRDEGSRNPMTLNELAGRMTDWLERGEYVAWLLCDGDETIGYALCQHQERGSEVYLRQYLIRQSYRRRGCGLEGIHLLREQFAGISLSIDVLDGNVRGRRFWAKAGFVPYSIRMRLDPPQ